MALLLAAIKRLPETIRAADSSEIYGGGLADITVGVHGAGGIGRRLIEMLEPFGCRILALNRSGADVPGADRVMVAGDDLEFFAECDAVALCAPLTAATRGLVGDDELEALGPGGILVNVGRGGIVDTPALVRALSAGQIRGVALDVTDPEPLPAEHPLWSYPNVLITPHVANSYETYERALAARVKENIRRLVQGGPLLGEVDPRRGY